MKKLIENIKTDLPIIALVPLILGGLWQVFSLSSISTAYLRFFSVTQQVADGILILFVLSIFYIIYYMFKDVIFSNQTNRVHLLEYKNVTLVLLAILSLVGAFSVIVVSASTILLIISGDVTLGIIVVATLFACFLIGSLLAMYSFIVALLKKNKMLPKIDFSSQPYAFIQTLLFGFLPILILGLLLNVIVQFHKSYYIPNNLKNIRYVLDKYSLETGANRDSIKIIYMNDKYIFIKDSSSVEVVKFEYMFRSETKQIK